MADKFVNLPLFDSVDYRYNIALEGNYYSLRITYNETMQLYTMSISDSNNNRIVSGMGLVPTYPIGADYVLGDLTGIFVLTSKSNKSTEFYKLYPTKIHEYYELNYIYADDSV
jgi:hypothetical protein